MTDGDEKNLILQRRATGYLLTNTPETPVRCPFLYRCRSQFRLKHLADVREFHRLDQNTANSLAKHNVRKVLAALIRHHDHRNGWTNGLDQKEYLNHVDPGCSGGTAEADKDRLRPETDQRIDRGIGCTDECGVIAMSCEPICKFQPEFQVLFHNHHPGSLTVLPAHYQISFCEREQ